MTDERILKERRRFPRLKHKTSVKFKPLKKGYMHQTEQTADTLNISEEGLCLESQYPFKEEEKLDVEITLAGVPMPLKLVVRTVWKKEDPNTRTTVAGFHIEEYSPNARRYIAKFVEKNLILQK